MCDMMTPPKMVPSALVSLGSSSTLMAGTRSDMRISLLKPGDIRGNTGTEARNTEGRSTNKHSADEPDGLSAGSSQFPAFRVFRGSSHRLASTRDTVSCGRPLQLFGPPAEKRELRFGVLRLF